MKRLIFPIINAIVLAALFGVVGYYLFDPPPWLLVGAGVGLGIGLLAEAITGRINRWFYRRRVLLVVLLEIPLMIFFVGPYAFALGMTRAANTPINGWTPVDFGSDYRAVSIPAADGVTLAGWFIPPVDVPGPAVMVLHGSAANRLQSRWHIEALAQAGYGVLTYDQRALGESTGTQQSAGWLDARDVPHLVDWLAGQPEVNPDRIGGVGLSLGAHILLFAGPDEPGIHAFWLDGASIGNMADLPPAEDFAEQFATLMNYQIVRSLTLQLGTQPPPPFIEQIPRLAPRPVVMIVGGLDVMERRANEPYANVLGENGEQWLIENAHHVGGPRVIPEEYTARMLAFFDTALSAAASP